MRQGAPTPATPDATLKVLPGFIVRCDHFLNNLSIHSLNEQAKQTTTMQQQPALEGLSTRLALMYEEGPSTVLLIQVNTKAQECKVAKELKAQIERNCETLKRHLSWSVPMLSFHCSHAKDGYSKN